MDFKTRIGKKELMKEVIIMRSTGSSKMLLQCDLLKS